MSCSRYIPAWHFSYKPKRISWSKKKASKVSSHFVLNSEVEYEICWPRVHLQLWKPQVTHGVITRVKFVGKSSAWKIKSDVVRWWSSSPTAISDFNLISWKILITQIIKLIARCERRVGNCGDFLLRSTYDWTNWCYLIAPETVAESVVDNGSHRV